MSYYVGVDLHCDNTFIAISDEEDKRLFSRRVSNPIEVIKETLEPFREEIKGIVVESTFLFVRNVKVIICLIVKNIRVNFEVMDKSAGR